MPSNTTTQTFEVENEDQLSDVAESMVDMLDGVATPCRITVIIEWEQNPQSGLPERGK